MMVLYLLQVWGCSVLMDRNKAIHFALLTTASELNIRFLATNKQLVSSREARLDMKARGFWTPRVTAFFDVRVTHVNSRSNQGKYTATIFKEQENEKKRK